ncbi:hypothetical protein KR50_03950 [Jeotgalibacillus campisalis]|uniref:Uncharacterized protein n=1 Tax=Jeotgalibacillus campisalis TaxID=220754 RepID=A0A0C2W910_9BACL|nr:hypothetical protein KR50_03950 [Jeotgalibacillus campisalis]
MKENTAGGLDGSKENNEENGFSSTNNNWRREYAQICHSAAVYREGWGAPSAL